MKSEESGEGLTGVGSLSSSGITVEGASGYDMQVDEGGSLVLVGGSSGWGVCSLVSLRDCCD